LKAAGLFPRRFLLAIAAFRVEPDGAAREAGRIEMTLLAHALEVQDGAQAARRNRRLD